MYRRDTFAAVIRLLFRLYLSWLITQPLDGTHVCILIPNFLANFLVTAITME